MWDWGWVTEGNMFYFLLRPVIFKERRESFWRDNDYHPTQSLKYHKVSLVYFSGKEFSEGKRRENSESWSIPQPQCSCDILSYSKLYLPIRYNLIRWDNFSLSSKTKFNGSKSMKGLKK